MSVPELIAAPIDRYRKAQFVELLASGNVRFQLITPELGVQTAIVLRTDIGAAPFRVGDETDLFLEHLTNQGNWVCRLWKIADNPWLSGDLPSIGSEVFGEIVSFAGNHIAIVELQVGATSIEAAINREELPDGQGRPISRTLQIGDRIRALVDTIDSDRLRISLSVSAWRRGAREEAARRNSEHRRQSLVPLEVVTEDVKVSTTPLNHRLLIVDDDRRLLASLRRWLELLGAEVETAHDEKLALSILNRFSPTRVLLDFVLVSRQEFERLASKLKASGTPVAIFTGSPERARERAVELGFGLISKPASLDELQRWLDDPKPAARQPPAARLERQEHQHWTYEAHAGAVLRHELRLIEQLSDRYQCGGVLWLVELRRAVFELRAASKDIDPEDINPLLTNLSHSIVAAAIASEHAIDGLLSPNDPLYVLTQKLGIRSPYYMAMPIAQEGLNRRVLVLFRARSFRTETGGYGLSTFDRIASRRDHFELLISALVQASHIDQVEAFATQGRLGAAALHEARNVLSHIAANVGVLGSSPWAFELLSARAALSQMNDDVLKLKGILSGSLELIQAERRSLTNLDRVVENVVVRMRNIAVDVHGKERLSILFKSRGDRLITAVPPSVIEQSLVNLLENAIGFLPDESWAQVHVSIGIDLLNRKTPIHIDVADNGPGMAVYQISHLFEPRITAKRLHGAGLGLYVSRNLLRAAGGDLELIETARWAGSTFRMTLPVILGAMDDGVAA